MTSLTTFTALLLRLILCGGKGLAPAWGPLYHGGVVGRGAHDWDLGAWMWDAERYRAIRPDRSARWVTDRITDWFLPLDAASPWPARLAMVAAWMLDLPCLAAQVQPETPELFFSLVMMPVDPKAEELRFVAWCEDGSEANTEANGEHGISLPTLPHHLQTHPPAVALLLALYDVPEIRARVENP